MFKKILLILFGMLIATNIYGADIDDFIRGTGVDVVEGTETISTLDDQITNYLQDPLDRLLDGYVKNATGTITSDTVYTVSAGKVCCENSAGTVHRFRENTSTTTVTNTSSGVGGLDTGSLAANKFYYIFAVADADATTFTAIMSESATNPTNANALYYKFIGVALTDTTSDWLSYYWSGNGSDITIMWDVPINETTTVSGGVWSAALDCSSSIPSISTMGIFGMQSYETDDTIASISIRPAGSTWSVSAENGIYFIGNTASVWGIAGQRWCMTDSSQQINYINGSGDATTAVEVEGFRFSR